MHKPLVIFATLLTALPLLASPVLAGNSPFTFSQPPNFSITNISLFIARIAQLLLIIGGILVFVYLVWGGIQWITSGGDAAGAKEARDKITAAIIGITIIALAVAISLILQYFFGITIIGTQATPRGF